MMQQKAAMIYAFGTRAEVESQFTEIWNYASANDIFITRAFKDYVREKGFRTFNEMICYFDFELRYFEFIEQTRILLVKNISILFEHPDYISALEKFAIEIHTVEDDRIYVTGKLSHKKGALQLKYRPGREHPSVPFGYCFELQEGNKVVFAVDHGQATVIRRIYNLYSTGRYSLRELVDIVEHDGSMKPGKKLSKSTIRRILKNSIYCGDFGEDDRFHQVRNTPIITQELFEKVQAAFKCRRSWFGIEYTKGER